MTRFARAKGSKSSNEKKPEEATSWVEMKNIVLPKKSHKAEEYKAVEEVKNDSPRQTEWASLGDDLSNSIALCKQNLSNKSKTSNSNNNKNNKNNSKSDLKSKKKQEKIDNNLNKTSSLSQKKAFQNKNKKKFLASEEINLEKNTTEAKKKNHKRTFAKVEENSEMGPSTKKKKSGKTIEMVSEAEEKQVQNLKKNEIKECKKFNKMKKEMKNPKNEINKSFNSSDNKGRQFHKKFNKQSKGEKKFINNTFLGGSSEIENLIINGEKIPIVKFQGFYITLEDAERLKKLRNEMVKEGIPKAKLEAALKLERRRAEKALSRLKKLLCFHCRSHGHLLSNCPKLKESDSTSTGICYKCGSTEHSASECKVVKGAAYQFAECFICKEQGHIARQCPDNPRGLYPQGGSCRECGDVTHLRKDCPKVIAQKTEEVVTVKLRSDRNLECLDEEIESREKQNVKNKGKKSLTVKF